jgi:hypothetical protein
MKKFEELTIQNLKPEDINLNNFNQAFDLLICHPDGINEIKKLLLYSQCETHIIKTIIRNKQYYRDNKLNQLLHE